MVGASVGLPLHDGALNGEFVSIAAHWTYIRRGRLGADFSVGVLPRVLSAGAMAVGARGGVALPFALSESVLLIPSAGIGAAGVAGGGGAIGVTGLNSGVALIFRAGSAGVRTGATWHRFRDSAGEALLWEVGFVSAPRWR